MLESQTAGKLEKRGIDLVARKYGWKPRLKVNKDKQQEAGWSYPVYHYANESVIGERWKAANKTTSLSPYAWIHGKPKDPATDWYILPATRLAIAEANGMVYLANGEPALLAYHAAGIHNVIATTLSEISVPKNLLQVLKSLGVSRLLYPIDNDEAGLTSAINWRDSLSGSGIDFQAFCWGDDAPEKADANDMWIAVGFNGEAFVQNLNNLVEIRLPAPEAKKEPIKMVYSGTGKAALIGAVVAGYENLDYRGHGRYINGKCLFHDDESASSGVDRETGWTHCFVCGNRPPEENALALGINIDDFFPKHINSKKSAKKAIIQHHGDSSSGEKADTALDENHISQWAKPVKLSKPKPTIPVNQRYISELPPFLLTETNAIRSAMATGKTTQIGKLFAEGPSGKRNLYISNTVALIDTACENISRVSGRIIESYRNIPMDYRLSPDGLGCSVDSLHTIRDDWDDVVIDEIEQVLRHFSAGTLRGGAAQRGYEKFVAIIRQAKRITVMDAHLSQDTVDWLQKIRGEEVNVVVNNYRHDWDIATIHEHKSTVVEAAENAAQRPDTQGVVIATNSKEDANKIALFMATRFGADKVLPVTGDSSASKEAQAFLRQLSDPNLAGEGMYQATGILILICSPSMATGIDVQLQVTGVFGVFYNQEWMDAYRIWQQMMRYRRAGERHLNIIGGAHREEGETTNAKDLFNLHIARAEGTALTAQFDDHAVNPFNEIQLNMLDQHCKMTAHSATHRNDLFSYAVAVGLDEGISKFEYRDGKNTAILNELREIGQALKEAKKIATMEAIPRSPEEVEAIIQSGEIDTEGLKALQAGLSRWKIELAAGQEINSFLYDELHTSQLRADFNRFVDMLDDMEALRRRDRDEASNNVLLIKRRHFTRNNEIIQDIITAAFGPDWFKGSNTIELSRDEINERLKPAIESHLGEIRTYIDQRFDLSDEPISVLRRLLRRVKLKLESKQIMVDGKRFYLYCVDGNRRAVMVELGMIALKARRERENELLKSRTAYLDKRVLSNEPSQPDFVPDDDEVFYEQWEPDALMLI